MGEARRRDKKGLRPRQFKSNSNLSSANQFSFFKGENFRERFFEISKQASWVGIGLLIAFWLIVRVVGPAAGWWTPADMK